jgi:DNA-binding winged helix-turn-helix (wHTH) protein
MEKPGRTGRMIHRFGDCELDEGRYELRRGGVPCHLETQVFEVLAHLVRNRGRLVTKTELLDQVWGSRFVSESALTSRIKAARKAVGDSGREQRMIRTVHGRGYEFLAPVQAVTAESARLPGRLRSPTGGVSLEPGRCRLPRPGRQPRRPCPAAGRSWNG